MEVLDRAECLRLLGGALLGRIVFTDRALPAVLPVTFVLSGGIILVRVVEGGVLAEATNDAVVAFEVDSFDPLAMCGWSVIAVGRTRSAHPRERVAAEHLRRWAPHRADRLIAIIPRLLNGRRLRGVIG
ncbi:hypothetical protein KALB_3340 [Kutzneria albida DSM 43870]|uniref:Pyridoxamine 5'-phosphate oxidase family protein n=2 Tax=Kutzneria TaxID=43356 RepID=W5W746_9PSEU|nr:hypothetical protein KALB_3340 [Kutzneria albida DSM 43870]